MNKQILSFIISLSIACISNAQTDSSYMTGIFEKITNEVKSYRLDTSAVANDKITQKINELRELRGGFNINDAIMFKLGEEEQKNETPKNTIAYLKDQFTNGKAKGWLDNAVVHIYRDHFSYRELKQLVKFYKTSAGQKLATDFPFIMMKTLMAAKSFTIRW